MRASGFLLLFTLLHNTDGLRFRKEDSSSVDSSEWTKLADDAKPVFYLVVMGKLAYRHQASTWVSTLRKIGGYKGEIIIVTDKPGCLQSTLTEAKLLGEQRTNNNGVTIYGPAEGYEGTIHVIKRPVTSSILKMKLEKARAWLNLKVANIPHPVSSIVYTDEDVVIAKDLTNFLKLVQELAPAQHTLALFRDTGKSAGELHTGVVVMYPGKHTDSCLQAWGKHLTGAQIGSAVGTGAKLMVEDSNDVGRIKEDQLLDEEIVAMGPDQQALGKTKECKKGDDHMGIKILPANYFWLPTDSGMKKGMAREFVHFTNTGRWKLIDHNLIKQYLYKLGLPNHIDPTGHVKDKTCLD